MNAYAKMKKTMEILNILVGLELIIIGLLYLIKSDISSAASWSIFGCMYIVMDKYSILGNMTKRRTYIESLKYSSAWTGFAISTAFLIYVILNM